MIESTQQTPFQKELYRFLNMAIQIWPSFQSGLKHLEDVKQPNESSYLSKRKYSLMRPEQFIKTIVKDLFEFIMTHDVKSDDIEDYLYDILQLLMIQEQLIGGNTNRASVAYMAQYTMDVITDLQSDKTQKIKYFEQNVYSNVKQFKGQIIEEDRNVERQLEGQLQDQSDEEYSDEQMQQQQQKPAKKEKTQEQIRAQQQLQDDGWIIVKKK